MFLIRPDAQRKKKETKYISKRPVILTVGDRKTPPTLLEHRLGRGIDELICVQTRGEPAATTSATCCLWRRGGWSTVFCLNDYFE
jgi:hypothetical protein